MKKYLDYIYDYFIYKINDIFILIKELFLFLPKDIVAISKLFSRMEKYQKNILINEFYYSIIKIMPILIFTSFILSYSFINIYPYQYMNRGVEVIYGNIFAKIIIKELIPLIIGIIITIRSTTYITIEIVQMKLSGELKNLELMGIDPYNFVSTVRLFAGIFILPIISLYFTLFSIIFGAISVNIIYKIDIMKFISEIYYSLNYKDVIVFFLKNIIFGFLIYKIAIYNGLYAKNSRLMITKMTLKAISESIITIILFDYFINKIL